MSEDTRLDRTIRWFKNNRLFSVLLLLAVLIVGASQLVGALSNLVSAGRALRHGDTASIAALATADTDGHADATIVAEYGGKGSGPGYFDGARTLSFDRDGGLVVSEWGNRGRVQRLGLTGEPAGQWYMSDDLQNDYGIAGVAIGADGSAYVAHGSTLYKRDLAAGRPLGQTDFSSCEPWIETVGVQSSGPIAICTQDFVLLRYGRPAPATTLRLPFKHDETFGISVASHLGIDGDDNIYMLDMDHCYVYKLAPDGTFVNRFGGDGMGNGLMHTPSAITVDGAGLVYVADLNGIEVFTGDGRFLRTIALPRIDTPFPIREMAVDRRHDLYAIYDDKLRVFRLPAVAPA